MTLDADAAQIVRQRIRERSLSFKEALNELIRDSGGPRSVEFRTKPTRMGTSRVNLDRALQIAGELEDDDLVRRIRAGS